jgi:hypothetical protein
MSQRCGWAAATMSVSTRSRAVVPARCSRRGCAGRLCWTNRAHRDRRQQRLKLAPRFHRPSARCRPRRANTVAPHIAIIAGYSSRSGPANSAKHYSSRGDAGLGVAPLSSAAIRTAVSARTYEGTRWSFDVCPCNDCIVMRYCSNHAYTSRWEGPVALSAVSGVGSNGSGRDLLEASR